jgi:hypothetical protein
VGRALRVAGALGGVVVIAIGVGLALRLAPTERDPLAPAFTRRVTSAFPDLLFVTCDVGQFEERSSDGTSAPQRWFVRPGGSGRLRVDLYAVAAGAGESGTLTATLYEPSGSPLGETSVAYPTAPTARSTAGSLASDVAEGRIYRLEVRRVAASSGAEAHHYRLGLVGIPVEVGMNSPALPHWFEGLNLGWQVVHVHVDAGEPLRLVVTAGEGQPVPFMTVELRGESGAILRAVTSRSWDPFEATLEAGPARTIRVALSGNHHFSLEKASGSDRGIYFDACPSQSAPS